MSTAAARSTAAGARSPGSPAGEAHGFLPVPPDRGDRVTVPEGFAYDVLIRWRDLVLAGAAPFDFGNQTEAAQSGQFGPNNDYYALVPLRPDGRRARRLRTRMTFLPAKRATGRDPRPGVAAARDASRPGGGGGWCQPGARVNVRLVRWGQRFVRTGGSGGCAENRRRLLPAASVFRDHSVRSSQVLMQSRQTLCSTRYLTLGQQRAALGAVYSGKVFSRAPMKRTARPASSEVGHRDGATAGRTGPTGPRGPWR
ncbi:alkaline phosphatase PhoX, partial [Streptomyces sp. NPDC017520]|uniref:alkaline phosphatase PhoX n=1 Tax=Streptomyces sp. NPDC017520 TaxID=3364998 RepID=UPI0037B0D897